MFYTIKTSILIISFCYSIVAIHKLINIFKNYRYGINDERLIRDLNEEEFNELVANICAIKNIDILNSIGKNLYECYKDGKKYLLFLNNNENFLDEEYFKLIYGYVLVKDVKGAIVISTEELNNSFKSEVLNLEDIDIIFYNKNDYYNEKIEIINNYF